MNNQSENSPLAFADHFSGHAACYAKFRPHYPDSLFEFLASLAPSRTCAWDCATGSGQSAIALAPLFKKVIATDASADQLKHAVNHPAITYQRATAEQSLLPDNSIDLISVAQAAHWFNLPLFYQECRRVAKKGALVAIWCYQLFSIDPAVDKIVARLYAHTLDKYWPAERKMVENGYQTLKFPFKEIPSPEFNMQAQWNLAQLLGYLNSWSAVQKYCHIMRANPVDALKSHFSDAWGDPQLPKKVVWPLKIRLGVVD